MPKYLSHLGPLAKSDGRHFSGKSGEQRPPPHPSCLNSTRNGQYFSNIFRNICSEYFLEYLLTYFSECSAKVLTYRVIIIFNPLCQRPPKLMYNKCMIARNMALFILKNLQQNAVLNFHSFCFGQGKFWIACCADTNSM